MRYQYAPEISVACPRCGGPLRERCATCGGGGEMICPECRAVVDVMWLGYYQDDEAREPRR